MEKINVAIIGASGYTGAEAVRLLVRHPFVRLAALSADRKAGLSMAEVYPHLAYEDLPKLARIDEIDWQGVDAVFCGLPHGTGQQVVQEIPNRVKVLDMSADFRLRDPALYASVYGGAHQAVELQREAVYGLTEIYREAISKARLVACPGCYPTTALLPLAPLLTAGVISPEDIIIDAKSGVSGAGRALKENLLHGEASEGLAPYAIAQHRHGPEIEQELSVACKAAVKVNFTPHLAPMNRGILATIYVRLSSGSKAKDLKSALEKAYVKEPFVHLAADGAIPSTRQVRGSNHCVIGVFDDRLPGRAILVSAIDNLVKGSAGQAIQNFNLIFGFDETTGLQQITLFP